MPKILTYTFFHVSPALVGLGFLIVDFSRSNSDTPHSIGLLWKNDGPIAKTSDKTHNNQRDIHTPGGFEPEIPASEPPQTQLLDGMATGISG